MKVYKTSNLRNVGIIGHGGSGKTTLTEALLYYTKAIDRMGYVEEGNTLSDFDPEEKRRGNSISTSVALCEWDDVKINLVDIPGYFDFVGEMVQGLKAVDLAMITVCGKSGIEVGTEKAWKYSVNHGLPRAFFINKLDRENSNFEKVLLQLKSKFGISVVPIQYPIGSEENFRGIVNVISRNARIYNPKTHEMEVTDVPEDLMDKVDECKRMIMEAVAETDEVLLDKYFDEGELSDEEIYNGLINGASKGEIVPVMCGSASKCIGINTLLEDIVECFPTPKDTNLYRAKNTETGEYLEMKIDHEQPFSAVVFKTIADPFVGKLSMFRVITGEATADTVVYNPNKDKEEKLGTLYFIKGKEQYNTKRVYSGDIGAVAKLQYTNTGDTLCEKGSFVQYREMDFPKPVYEKAAVPKGKGDEDKIAGGLHKLMEEDPTLIVDRNSENSQAIIHGLGVTHLDVIASKLKNKFGVDIELKTPRIAYRETIKKSVDVQGKYKKQSGGHGQYGDVKILFEPRIDGEDELLFKEKVVGGVVPRGYIPAVEKGLKDCIKKGVLAGYPVIRLKATLHDGSYHPVDSSEMAFKMAASMAYKKGIKEAQPIILEPIMHVEISAPDDYTGDIISDLNRKRGRILGMEPLDGVQKIIGEVPRSEMFEYATELRSMTGARGNFEMNFGRYEEVPREEVDKIIAAASNEDGK
ncbi:elongation factor G [Oceanirhabdus seepicola]|uniref:Elongation factor G n=1 Tax=Oceanirhabdus seepicola TaxID=2828781 RepID=A0A9J6P163_9CLOT|nr:elongation factor G [Oceanirhabdus seepicola]MCM1989605.1 elongation factor G [Oceanirhabdus seepicola]